MTNIRMLGGSAACSVGWVCWGATAVACPPAARHTAGTKGAKAKKRRNSRRLKDMGLGIAEWGMGIAEWGMGIAE